MIRASSNSVRLLRQSMTPRHGTIRMKNTISRPLQRHRYSYLNVPSADKRKLQASLGSKSDVIVYNLQECDINPNGKRARENLCNLFSVPRSPDEEPLPEPNRVAVKISSVDSPQFGEDVKIFANMANISTVVISKATSIKDIRTVEKAIAKYASLGKRARSKKFRIVASIEDAYGLLNMRSIVSFCGKKSLHCRLSGLLFEAEAYCYNNSMIRTPEALELLYTRMEISLMARIHGLEAIDMACIDYRSRNNLWLECEDARQLGFTGKQTQYPSHVDDIRYRLAPRPDDNPEWYDD